MRNVAAELESLSIILDKYINPLSKENFYIYFRAATNTLLKTFIMLSI